MGSTWEQIVAQREQPAAVRTATREAATAAAKQAKKDKRAAASKAAATQRQQGQVPKVKSTKGSFAPRPAATSR